MILAVFALLAVAPEAAPLAAKPAAATEMLLADASRALEADDPRRALALYDQLLASHPGSADAEIGRATALQEAGKAAEALGAWRVLAEKYPARADAAIGLARALWRADLREESGRTLRGLKGQSVKAADLLALARLQVEMGNPAAAVKAATLALGKDPRSAEALMIRADALDYLKQWKRADADGEAALKLGDTARTRYLRGKRAASISDHKGAVEEFTALLDKHPGHVSARVERARARLELGEHDTALRDLHVADRERPSDLAIFLLKAKIYHQLDDHLLARDYLIAAKRLDPGNADMLELLEAVEGKLQGGMAAAAP
jgi:tetratricopeptide (TPR) repeat protein